MNDVELARAVAVAAGALLLKIREDFGPIAEESARKELKKQGDLGANALIMAKLRAARPGDGFLTEEEKDNSERLSARRVWIVDPLDGTREYSEGRSDCAVHIALWQCATASEPGRILASVVDLPAQAVTRTTVDEDATLPPLSPQGPLRVVASRTRPPARLGEILATWSRLTGREVVQVDVGSVGAKVEEILAGRAEAYLHDTGFFEWDVAAPMGVAHHYGLVLEHWDGQPLTMNKMPPWVPNVVVVRPELADTLRQAIRG